MQLFSFFKNYAKAQSFNIYFFLIFDKLSIATIAFFTFQPLRRGNKVCN